MSLVLAWMGCARGADLPSFDFTSAAGLNGWTAAHDLATLQASADGMICNITGGDPFLSGPAADYPVGTPLWLKLRLLSDAGGVCQIFYYKKGGGATESASVRLAVPAGTWVTGRVPLPALGAAWVLRIDPPGVTGRAVLRSIAFEVRNTLPDFDLSTVPDSSAWAAQHDISTLAPTLDGLDATITAGDPYFAGPARDYPSGTPLWMLVRIRSDQGGMAQVFYYDTGPTEDNSVHFAVPAGTWADVKVPVPALGAGYRLRFDPPGNQGHCVVSRIRFLERPIPQAPAWPKPGLADAGASPLVLRSGAIEVRHNPRAWGAYEVRVDGRVMGGGNTNAILGYAVGNVTRWIQCQPVRAEDLVSGTIDGGWSLRATIRDADGGTWTAEQLWRSAPEGFVDVETRISVDRDRNLLYFPAMNLLAGIGSYGTNKHQALLPGVEYLENEPSSSEADLTGAAAKRQVPDSLKITIPLMAVEHDGRYIGLSWVPDPRWCAVFDSPDRIFKSGGHLMGLMVPGSDGSNREEGNLLPYGPETLVPGQPLVLHASVIGGVGASTMPAVQAWVHRYGLPGQPDIGRTTDSYWRLAAKGWLDSGIREDVLYRHALWTGFNPQPAADASVWMDWLASQIADAPLQQRLRTAAQGARGQVAASGWNFSGVGHVRFPVASLIYGSVAENALQARAQARAALDRFQSDGTVLYQASAGGLDYGSTHWEKTANGFTAAVLAPLLEQASSTVDRPTLDKAVAILHALERYRYSVPRGAQTWEIPLHTPDIMGSAYLAKAYTLGYEWTGDTNLLENAKYWAWTGVPFVYLVPPVQARVGVYSTIPVLGASGWTAPVWIGLPVQWCGLVYADAIRRLSQHDPSGPWNTIAEGIVRAGVQHTWTETDTNRVGLLPDSYVLRAQLSDGPAINPATLLASASFQLGGSPIYTHRSFPRYGLGVDAPGAIDSVQETASGITFRFRSWSAGGSYVMIAGLRSTPAVYLDGQRQSLGAPHSYRSADGWLILKIPGDALVRLDYTAQAALQIQPVPGSRSVRLAWPSAATNFQLEWADHPLAPVTWRAWGSPPTPSGTQFLLTNNADGAERYFRLRSIP